MMYVGLALQRDKYAGFDTKDNNNLICIESNRAAVFQCNRRIRDCDPRQYEKLTAGEKFRNFFTCRQPKMLDAPSVKYDGEIEMRVSVTKGTVQFLCDGLSKGTF